MKKSLLTVFTALALTACGGQSEQASKAAAPQTDANAASAPASGLPETNALNIYNWSNYVDESTVEDFKKANSFKLTYDLYENNEALEAKVLTGQPGTGPRLGERQPG